MGAENASAVAPPQGAPPPPAKRERVPASPEKLAAQSSAAAARRQLRKLDGVRSIEELYSRVDELRGKAKEPQKPADAAGAAQPQTPKPAQRTGWPSDDAIASTTAELYFSACQLLDKYPQKYRPTVQVLEVLLPKKNADGSLSIVEGKAEMEKRQLVNDPAQRLASSCAPLIAKHLEGVQTSPEKMAVVGVLSVLAPPLVMMAFDLAKAGFVSWRTKRKEAQAEAKAKNPAQPAAAPQKPQLVQGTAK